ncbi:MAG: chorismate synthase [Candidatus Zixiibacteriota bacterium]|nr:MAG: chorismate synthase [candidate division Zixibacteria bacterium]
MLRFLTAGESHGMALTGIIEGLPAGLKLDVKAINEFLQRRQRCYGRGVRMKKIENDSVTIIGGVRRGVTIGSPLALQIENRDWANCKDKKSSVKNVPRPGHADLAGVMKYGFNDIQNVIERSSARETAMRTAIGAVARIFLAEFGVDIIGHTVSIGDVKFSGNSQSPSEIKELSMRSMVYCADPQKSRQMCEEIDAARERGETLGGTFEVIAVNVPPGLGSYVHWDRKIDGRLSQAILSIPSVKAIEIGEGFSNASRKGSQAHDHITSSGRGIRRTSNRAGGIEGGVTNGELLTVRGYAKPISSLKNPLPSVNIKTGQATNAPYVRSDVCVVPAICVIAEAMLAWVLAEAFVEKFGGDSIHETKTNYRNFTRQLESERGNLTPPGAYL